jgi:hypothetical protein
MPANFLHERAEDVDSTARFCSQNQNRNLFGLVVLESRVRPQRNGSGDHDNNRQIGG